MPRAVRILSALSLALAVQAFPTPLPTSRTSNTRLFEGTIETLEFKIFPDGRVQEVVRGVKGSNCHKVTEKINESLGKVIDSAPTEELYEQEIVVEQTLTETVGGDSASGTGDSWEGQSSW